MNIYFSSGYGLTGLLSALIIEIRPQPEVTQVRQTHKHMEGNQDSKTARAKSFLNKIWSHSYNLKNTGGHQVWSAIAFVFCRYHAWQIRIDGERCYKCLWYVLNNYQIPEDREKTVCGEMLILLMLYYSYSIKYVSEWKKV